MRLYIKKFNLIVILFICILLLSIFSKTCAFEEKSKSIPTTGITLYVGGSGPGNYSDIQEAIDNASCGNTIFVFNGIYCERLFINKSINLIGEEKNLTIIDGSEVSVNKTLIFINVDNVKISGFTIRDAVGINGRALSAGNKKSILMITRNITITNNIFRNFSNGGFIINPKNCVFTDNLMFNCGVGVYYTHAFNFNNDFSNNFINGKTIFAYFNRKNFNIDGEEAGAIFLHNCRNVEIKNMKLSNTTVGVDMSFCRKVTISNLTITNTGRGGIYAFKSSFCRFIGNTFENDSWGIFLRKSNFNTIKNNNFINISQPDWFASSYFNNWNKNYWGEPYSSPKKIIGNIEITYKITMPFYDFDWFPLQEPFEYL